MRGNGVVRGALALVCGAVLPLVLLAAPARAAFDDPLFVGTFPIPAEGNPPPVGPVEGPCGLAVDSGGRFYVSDYYHHAVDVFHPPTSPFTNPPGYITQLPNEDPLDGPCGLAVDSTGKLYVNNFHRNVVRFTPSVFPPVNKTTTYGSELTIDSEHPTGVAVDPGTNNVYVDNRTYVSAYDPSGAPLLDGGGDPLQIGLGSLFDGYGVAVAAGRLYVGDAASNTVKVYDPTVNGAGPLATISGPPGGFKSLLDSVLAVDRVSGDLYVADRRGSMFAERPETTIQVFSSTGVHRGRLKYGVIDAVPVGLAVDNSFTASQGRVYVTSGNSSLPSVYAYPPGAATLAALPAPGSVAPGTGAEDTVGSRAAGTNESGEDPALARGKPWVAEQVGTLKVVVDGKFSPQRLSREGKTPIAVSVGWKITTTDGSAPPELKTVRIEINRNGRFDYAGLPVCPYDKIQPASTARALANCRSALVGRGEFAALVGLEGQEPYVARGQMVIFNGRENGRPVLLGQIYSPYPFANSFVIVFALDETDRGRYGTTLTATLPRALRSWGSLTEVEMRLSRRFHHGGQSHSFLSAGCPAPPGFSRAAFPLARTSFDFVGARTQSLTLTRSCKAR